MAFNLPNARYLNNTRLNDANRGIFGANLGLGRKANGNLPLTLDAAQVTAGVADGVFGGVYLGLDAQDGNATENPSTETMVLVSSFQFNAPNRIQVNTLANNGVVVRLASGSGDSPTDFKQFVIGGNDTPLASAQAGPVTICLDLNAPNENSMGGNFDNTAVSAWGYGITKGNIIGGGSSLSFLQRVFIFTTTKGSSGIPTFTGTGANFDDAFNLLQGSDYTDKIGAWITKSGTAFFLPAPLQFGDGATITQFDDGGATLISPENNALGAENFRISNQAMRVYLNLRDDAADSVVLSGSYVWGTAADWDFNESKLSSCLLSGSFSGMGNFTLGASVTANGNFNLSTGSFVVCNGANIDNINVTGDLKIQGNSVNIFNGLTVNGALNFDTSGTYNFTGCNITEVTNTSGGNIVINVDNNTIITTNNDPTIIIVTPPKLISLSGLIIGSRVQIYNQNNSQELENIIVTGETFNYVTQSGEANTGDLIRVRATQQSGTNASLPFETVGIFGAEGVGILISQSPDIVYNTYGIDGSLVTRFQADFVNSEIDIVASSDFEAKELYAWWVYSITFDNGIRDFFGGLTAVDLANLRLNNDVVSIFLDTTTSENIVQIDNIRIYRKDEAYPVIDPTTGGGAIDIVWRNNIFIAQTGTSGLTPEESQKLTSIDNLTKLIPATL